MSYDFNAASKQYLRMKIESSSAIGLVIILYDGGIKFLSKACEELSNKRIMGFTDNIVKAQNVIRELRDSLDMNVTDIAPQLRALYSYMLKRLIMASVEKNIEPITEVLKMMESLRETWEKVKNMAESGQIEMPKKQELGEKKISAKPIAPNHAPSIFIRG